MAELDNELFTNNQSVNKMSRVIHVSEFKNVIKLMPVGMCVENIEEKWYEYCTRHCYMDEDGNLVVVTTTVSVKEIPMFEKREPIRITYAPVKSRKNREDVDLTGLSPTKLQY